MDTNIKFRIIVFSVGAVFLLLVFTLIQNESLLNVLSVRTFCKSGKNQDFMTTDVTSMQGNDTLNRTGYGIIILIKNILLYYKQFWLFHNAGFMGLWGF